MVNDKNKQNIERAESNDERDQDEGNMNNGAIGGNMGTMKSSKDGSKAGNRLATDESSGTSSSKAEGGAAENS